MKNHTQGDSLSQAESRECWIKLSPSCGFRVEEKDKQYFDSIKALIPFSKATDALIHCVRVTGRYYGLDNAGTTLEVPKSYSPLVMQVAGELMRRGSMTFDEAISLMLEEAAKELTLNGYESAHREAAQEAIKTA